MPYVKRNNNSNIFNLRMQFKSLLNIESSFRQIRLFGIIFVCLCAVICCYVVWSSFVFAEAQRQRIYILDQGKSLIVALSQDAAQNRPVEAREHVRRFHELFFTLSPDKNAIESNISRALLLSDRSTYNYYRDLMEKGFYNRIISGNVIQNIRVDSISGNFENYPYLLTTYATQFIMRESNMTERTLITDCRLLNTSRSDDNPQGFLIEGFEIKENRDIRTIKR